MSDIDYDDPVFSNTVVLDLETCYSAGDCAHCLSLGEPQREAQADCPAYRPIGWYDHAALGLSIGAYWSYADRRVHWFDTQTLGDLMRAWIERPPLLVTFNGRAFDVPLMRAVLAEEAMGPPLQGSVGLRMHALAEQSYDILHEIWRADPARKFERGLNSLDALARANGLGAKTLNGALAPALWRQGHYAEVLNYCQDDIFLTKALYELIVRDGRIKRGDGQHIELPRP